MKTNYSAGFDAWFINKRIILFSLIAIISLPILAQNKDKSLTLNVGDSHFLENLIKKKTSDYVITSEHISSTSGIRHIYIRQAIDGIEINGTESDIHLAKNGKVVASHNKFIDLNDASVEKRTPVLSQEQAIQSAAQKMGYAITSLKKLEDKAGVNRQAVYNNGGISRIDIPIKLVYQLTAKERIVPAWEFSIDDINSNEYWYNFQVDAITGEILSKQNYIAECNFAHEHSDSPFIGPLNKPITYEQPEVESAALLGNYMVYAIPVESPNHGSRTFQSNPQLAGSGSPFGWHDTNGVEGPEFIVTAGNNVDAFGHTTGNRPSGGPFLDFNFGYILPPTATALSQENPAITNLFYWNNIMHDVLYEYGFDEASGNFQVNNYGHPGLGFDHVIAEGQKINACNAFFGTPVDGLSPTMQMFICSYGGATGDRDGDFDSGVISHEYAHGISTRLTGGAGNSSCLTNQEQMGEGWSDFFSLIVTLEPGDLGTDARGIGTWLIGQAPSGVGIRTQRYDTDDNTYTYDSIKTEVAPHGVGSVWAMMLWEMTWDLIGVHGIGPNVYSGTGGNNIAMAIVTEGLKLQPCSPGFVDGRNAILAADMALYGGANQCTIWEAFAKRGLGMSANQGSSSSKADGTQAFNLVALSLSRNSVCLTEGIVSGLSGGLSPAGGVYSGNGVIDDGNGTTFSFDTAGAGVFLGTNQITFTESCTNTSANANIEVTSGFPTLVCQNTTVTLDGAGNASIIPLDVVSNMLPPNGANGYTVNETGTYNALNMTGGTVVNLGDDAGSAAIPLGFTFDFFGIGYTNLYISSNGYITFETEDLTDFSADFLPSTAIPDAIIALAWDDLNPNNGANGTIRYRVVGSAPNRVMVVEYFFVPHFGNTALVINVQAQLYEGSNRIEIHSNRVDSDGGLRTQGIENENGTIAYTAAGRNASNWSIPPGGNAFVAFIPIGGNLPDNCGNPVITSLSQSAFTCKDIGDVVVTVTADDGLGGISTCQSTVTVIGPTSTWTGAWDVLPTATRKARINSAFNTGINGAGNGNIDACSCDINANLVINSGSYLKVAGNIKVNTSLLVENGGSVVQVDDAASVTKIGSILVKKTTPVMAAKSFMISGSPMTAETRVGVFGSSYIVRNHVTANFVPNLAVEAVSPGINNWADDNGNNWLAHTGLLNPGAGYLVFPQPNGTATGSFIQNHTLGTLNNGVVNFTMGYNGTQNSSPSMLANPYASAIDAEVFFDDPANANIDVVYFWEHNTPLSILYPGYSAANFSMSDISLYSESLGAGVAAASGGAVPTRYIASGQGFGVKPTAGGVARFNNAMRVTGPNNNYRTNDIIARDRLWLKVYNDTYGLGSTALIGFTETTSDGFINSEDVYRLPTPVSLYSELETGEELVVNALGTFEVEDAFYLSFTTQVKEVQNYRISIDNLDGVNMEAASVYLIDALTGAVTNLTEGDYTFQSGEAIYHKRFKVVFENSALGINDATLDSVSIYPNPTQHSITIVSPQAIVTSATVYDIRGRKVSEVDFRNNTAYQIDMSKLESALYFVEISTESGTVTKRVLKK